MHKLDEVLQHAGVKGMKWGVRRDTDKDGGADGKTDPKDNKAPTKETGKIGKHLYSMKRERQWTKTLHQVDSMSTKDISSVTKRISMENNLKSLSKTKIATKKDKDDYLRRHEMDNQELSRKVTRLQAKDSLLKAVKASSKEQREFGLKVVQVGGSLGVKYATTKSITPKDIFDAVKNPKSSADKAKKDVMTKITEKAQQRGGTV